MNGAAPRNARAFDALMSSLLTGAFVPTPTLPAALWNMTELPTEVGLVNFATLPVVPETCADAEPIDISDMKAVRSTAFVANGEICMTTPLPVATRLWSGA